MFQDFNKNKKVENKSLKGYSLVELMLAMFFFAIIAVCLALPFSNSINLSVNDQDVVNANNLAKRYLKSVEIKWQFQPDYDAGSLPALTSEDKGDGRYSVGRSTQIIRKDSDDNVILRRVTIKYSNKSGQVLARLFSDFDRPGASLK